MKRAVHIFFWVSLVLAMGVVLLRSRNEKNKQPSETFPASESTMETVTPVSPPNALPLPPRAASPDIRMAATPLPDETALVRQIRAQVKSNPSLALKLAQEARERFGDSAEADERDKLLVEALINLQRIGEARVETEYYYKHHADGQYGRYLWSMTGARPAPPSGP